MKTRAITVNLMGGLVNQMFQYAAGRALTIRNSGHLYLDITRGFKRDKVYPSTYELGGLLMFQIWLEAQPPTVSPNVRLHAY